MKVPHASLSHVPTSLCLMPRSITFHASRRGKTHVAQTARHPNMWHVMWLKRSYHVKRAGTRSEISTISGGRSPTCADPLVEADRPFLSAPGSGRARRTPCRPAATLVEVDGGGPRATQPRRAGVARACMGQRSPLARPIKRLGVSMWTLVPRGMPVGPMCAQNRARIPHFITSSASCVDLTSQSLLCQDHGFPECVTTAQIKSGTALTRVRPYFPRPRSAHSLCISPRALALRELGPAWRGPGRNR